MKPASNCARAAELFPPSQTSPLRDVKVILIRIIVVVAVVATLRMRGEQRQEGDVVED
jgi:hypothetical protein